MYELGLALPQHVQFQQCAQELADRFARQMGAIVLYQVRSGNEYVCSVRTGAVKMTGLMVYPGTRRPLLTSSGGVAILQTMPADEAQEVLADNVHQEIKRHGTTRLASMQLMLEKSRHYGFGVNLGYVVPGSHAFGVPLVGENGSAFAAICLIGTPDTFGEERLSEVHDRMRQVAAQFEERAREFGVIAQ